MKVIIDETVRKMFPEMNVFFTSLKKEMFVELDDMPGNVKLTEQEYKEYQSFRKKAFGDTLLAVERLVNRGESNLPAPDHITGSIIRISYATCIPITVFCDDSFNSITLRFSEISDVLKTNRREEQMEPGLLVADTDQGILGILGTKSSSLGKLSKTSKNLIVLSFGCSKQTNKKSKKLINLVTEYLKVN